MNSTATSYADASRALTELLSGVPVDSWDRPSPCPDWSARDVLRHLIETQRDFLGERGVDLGEVPDVEASPAGAWQTHSERVLTAVAHDAVTTAPYDGFFGPTTVGATFEQFYVWDMLVHRWDIARAVSAEDRLSDAELTAIESGAEGFGPALYMDGICRPAVEVPAGADRTAQVLARLGRVA